MNDRPFDLGVVLTLTTDGIMLSESVGDVHEACDFLTGDQLMTHQLVRALPVCGAHAREQHPDLADLKPPEGEPEEILRWVHQMRQIYGPSRRLTPLPPDRWERRNPIDEMAEMRGGYEDIYVVCAETEES